MNNSDSDYRILYLDDTSDPLKPTLKLLDIKDKDKPVNTEMLSGIATRDRIHYLSTRGKGIYRVAEADLLANTEQLDIPQLIDHDDSEDIEKRNRLFMGMIKLNDGTIIAVERNGGTLFKVQEQGFGFMQMKYKGSEDVIATGRYATGALALWQNVNNEEEKMLVAGIQGGLYSTTTTSSYTHGYVEFELNPDGSINLSPVSRDIKPNITVNSNYNLYTATIGKHPINHLYQAPESIDNNMIFFASTQTAGLWSYRVRSEGPQWNAEE